MVSEKQTLDLINRVSAAMYPNIVKGVLADYDVMTESNKKIMEEVVQSVLKKMLAYSYMNKKMNDRFKPLFPTLAYMGKVSEWFSDDMREVLQSLGDRVAGLGIGARTAGDRGFYAGP